ncbi:hypothetical protein ABIB39_004470 [Mucilaginibacter sp. UYP27]
MSSDVCPLIIYRKPRSISEANSAIIIVVAFVFAVGICGIIEASAILNSVWNLPTLVGICGIIEASAIIRPFTPRTISRLSTTDCGPIPIAQVPTGWKYVEQASRRHNQFYFPVPKPWHLCSQIHQEFPPGYINNHVINRWCRLIMI